MRNNLLVSIVTFLFLLTPYKIVNAEDKTGNADVLKTNNGWNLFFKMEEIENGFSRCKKKVILLIDVKKGALWKEWSFSPYHESKKMILSWNEYSPESGEITDFIFDKGKFSFKIKKYIYVYPEKKPFVYFIQIAGNIKKESSLLQHEGYGELRNQTGDLDIQGIGVYIGPTNIKEKTEIEWKLIDKIIIPYQEIE